MTTTAPDPTIAPEEHAGEPMALIPKSERWARIEQWTLGSIA